MTHHTHTHTQHLASNTPHRALTRRVVYGHSRDSWANLLRKSRRGTGMFGLASGHHPNSLKSSVPTPSLPRPSLPRPSLPRVCEPFRKTTFWHIREYKRCTFYLLGNCGSNAKLSVWLCIHTHTHTHTHTRHCLLTGTHILHTLQSTVAQNL